MEVFFASMHGNDIISLVCQMYEEKKTLILIVGISHGRTLRCENWFYRKKYLCELLSSSSFMVFNYTGGIRLLTRSCWFTPLLSLEWTGRYPISKTNVFGCWFFFVCLLLLSYFAFICYIISSSTWSKKMIQTVSLLTYVFFCSFSFNLF